MSTGILGFGWCDAGGEPTHEGRTPQKAFHKGSPLADSGWRLRPPKENIFSERLGPDGGAGPRTSPGRGGFKSWRACSLWQHTYTVIIEHRPERLTIPAARRFKHASECKATWKFGMDRQNRRLVSDLVV